MIDTEALRKKVIDLAIQGKLTEQLPSDGGAETLYAQIQDHKSQLINEGKIKKEKPLPDIAEDEIPFDIPGNWKWVHMGDIFDHNTGKALNNADKEGTKLEYITTSNMYWDHFELDGLKSMFFKESEIEKCTIRKGDLLICEGGDIGRSAIWNFDYEMRIQNHIHKLRGYGGIDHRFYFYLMRNYKDNGMIDGRGIGLQGFSAKRVHSLVVPLAPLAEQKRISDKLEEVLAQIDIIDDLQTKYSNDLAVLKGKIIDAGIQGKLTEQLPEDGDAEDLYAQIQNQKSQLIKEGKLKKEKPLPDIAEDEIPFEIPKNWKWVHIATVGLTVTGTTPPKENKEYYDGEYPFFKPSDLDAGRHITVGSESLTNEGWKVSRQLRKGSILVCCIGTIGKSAIIDVDGTTNQQINAITPILCDSDYLLFAIDSDSFQRQLQQRARATTVTIIKKSRFDECIIPLPTLSEQKRIAKRINELLSMMELIEDRGTG